ncbi:MAG: Nramp family divalent metal transporter [Streptococcaceae bacterium]|nr:Nramp family divalent metal transporter [Streptococcaceae bacterium]
MKNIKRFETHSRVSLEEVNSTIDVPEKSGFWKNFITFFGPGALVAVGYMDPGNWVTSIGGGAQYGYLLLSVVLLSSLIAMLLQYMSAKLGIVSGLDLAQAIRLHTGRKTGFILWIITELAIMATDIAEVIGSAIALKLLFNIPLVIGVLITIVDVFLLLFLMKLGFRKIEAIVISLILVIILIFIYQVALANPDFSQMIAGFVPQTEILSTGQLTMALGIVGATVMPHNLFLHSSIAQTRKFDRKDEVQVTKALKFTAWDSNIQLIAAFMVNCLLLILGAALFYGKADNLGTLTSVYEALKDKNISGAIASPILSTLFAVALLASGQNSTITGTLSGQIIMEGFVHIKLPLWARRLITRLLAVIPVLIVTIWVGGDEHALDILLIDSQVFLSLALPFSIVPLIYFTSSKKVMGNFKNSRLSIVLGSISALLLILLNIYLLIQTVNTIF